MRGDKNKRENFSKVWVNTVTLLLMTKTVNVIGKKKGEVCRDGEIQTKGRKRRRVLKWAKA